MLHTVCMHAYVLHACVCIYTDGGDVIDSRRPLQHVLLPILQSLDLFFLFILFPPTCPASNTPRSTPISSIMNKLFWKVIIEFHYFIDWVNNNWILNDIKSASHLLFIGHQTTNVRARVHAFYFYVLYRMWSLSLCLCLFSQRMFSLSRLHMCAFTLHMCVCARA